MSVLIEALCVVLKASSVIEKFPGGFEAFAAAAPPGTLCADGELVRVGFLRPQDVQDFLDALEAHGFEPLASGKAQDLVVAAQTRGLLAPCEWAEFALVPWICAPLAQVAICRTPGTPVEPIVTPEGWSYENSLSAPRELTTD